MTKNSNIAVIITAAGSSTRMGGSTKKEYLPYKNGTVLSNSAKTFLKTCLNNYKITDFIITCPSGGIDECNKILGTDPELTALLESSGVKLQVTEGSSTRQASVFNALKAVNGNPEIVLIHDGARPFVSSKLIEEGISVARECGASVPGLTPTDTQKRIDENGFIVEHLVRSQLCAVQTPQCFNYEKLFKAHKTAAKENFEYTDDTEIWGNYYKDQPVKVYAGDVNNIKITYPADLLKLEK